MSLPESETVMGFSVQRCLSSACFVSIFSLLQVLFKRTCDAVLLVMDIKQRQSTKQNKLDYKQKNIFYKSKHTDCTNIDLVCFVSVTSNSGEQ